MTLDSRTNGCSMPCCAFRFNSNPKKDADNNRDPQGPRMGEEFDEGKFPCVLG